jgi:nuclear pore complex protein Nup155
MNYADLLTSSKGRDIARNLVSAIINIQIGQNLSIDAVSDVLQQRCGSFCSADDVLLYKVSFVLLCFVSIAGCSDQCEWL